MINALVLLLIGCLMTFLGHKMLGAGYTFQHEGAIILLFALAGVFFLKAIQCFDRWRFK